MTGIDGAPTATGTSPEEREKQIIIKQLEGLFDSHTSEMDIDRLIGSIATSLDVHYKKGESREEKTPLFVTSSRVEAEHVRKALAQSSVESHVRQFVEEHHKNMSVVSVEPYFDKDYLQAGVRIELKRER